MLDKFNAIYTKLIYEWSNPIENDYIKAKKEYEEVKEDYNNPKYKYRNELYNKVRELETLYSISNGEIPWGDWKLPELYTKYVQYITNKNPLNYPYKTHQYIELKNAKDMSTKLYYIDRKISDSYMELRGVKLKQQETGIWKAQTTKYDGSVYGFKTVVPDIDEEGNYCLTHYKRFYLINNKQPIIKNGTLDINACFYPIENIDQWVKENNVDLMIEEPVVHLTDKEVCKNWGSNPHSPEFEYAYKRHEQMMKERPEQHKMTENSSSPSSNYSTTECTCGFEYETDYS